MIEQDIFGVWLMGGDGAHHYYLRGEVLCGAAAAAAPTGRPAPSRHAYGSGPKRDVGRDCPRCRAANERRWLKMSGRGASAPAPAVPT